MMKRLLPCLLLALACSTAQAYTTPELLADCQAAETAANDPGAASEQAQRGARCTAYLSGFADAYAVSEFLADKIGVGLNAFCLPRQNDLMYRMVRAVVIHLERTPPNTTATPATLVAGALGKSFPCNEALDGRK